MIVKAGAWKAVQPGGIIWVDPRSDWSAIYAEHEAILKSAEMVAKEDITLLSVKERIELAKKRLRS